MMRRALPLIGAGALLCVLAGWYASQRSRPDGQSTSEAVLRQRFLIYVESDLDESPCRSAKFDRIWTDNMRSVIEMVYERARELKRKGVQLDVELYALDASAHQRIGALGSNDWQELRYDTDWAEGVDDKVRSFRRSHKAIIKRPVHQNVIASVATIIARSRELFAPGVESVRLIYVSDMLHYNEWVSTDSDGGMFNFFDDDSRREFAVNVTENKLYGSIALQDIAGMTDFRVYSIDVSRSPCEPWPRRFVPDYDRLNYESRPIWDRLFRTLGAADVVLGLTNADGIQ